jgi:hypothetical protein
MREAAHFTADADPGRALLFPEAQLTQAFNRMSEQER